MNEQKKPRVIILENDATILEQARSILTTAGWDVTCEKTSKAALNLLSHSKKSIFALFITDSKLPKMEGDDILKAVKSLSPFTQRMMLLPSDNPDILINAINKAKVNACITIPFKEEDLISLSKNCYKKFKHAVKKEQLKRISGHQNKQMYQTAQKLKKKDNVYKQQIDKKNARILKLKSKARKIQSQRHMSSDIDLLDLINKKSIQIMPDSFKNEFLFLCDLVKKNFTPLTKDHQIDPDTLDIQKILSTPDQSQEETPAEKNDTQDPDQQSYEKTADEAGAPETDSPSPDDKGSIISEENQTPEQEKTPPPHEGPPTKDLITRILTNAFMIAMHTQKTTTTEVVHETDAIVLDGDDNIDSQSDETTHLLDKDFEITISDDQTSATLKKILPDQSDYEKYSSAEILDLLRHKHISFGILDDDAIDTWLSKSNIDQVIIASGDAADPGENGSLKFHFETEFTNPGKINEDGTIDFRDRGEIPFVEKDTLLAQKKPARESKPGMSISSTPIPVEETIDPAFEAGPGTQLSEDGLSIHAAIDGQPHLDKLGTISVNPELVIPGDVDYETGNVDFKGNIVVKGRIKEGFKVKGINLIAQEIEGGIVDISGDLNVSAGINEAIISTQGNIYAKFINKSKIMGFGNLTISKEIIDSTIHLSGKCINDTGHILSSKITAKLGINAGKIGTPSSKSSTFKVGIDEHLEILKSRIKEKLETSVSKSKLIKDEIKKLEHEDQELYQQISKKAHTQDRAQLDIKEMIQELKQLEAANDTAQLPLVKAEIKNINETAKNAEKELNDIFETQDRIANDIQTLQNQLLALEKENKTQVQAKKALKTFEEKEKPEPVISVAKTIIQGNIIKGPHSTMVLSEDKSRCKIQELRSQETGLNLFEMTISDL